MPRFAQCPAVVRSLACIALVVAAMPRVADAEPATAQNARDAGARYGQALGSVEICIGTKTTEKAAALAAAYTGDDEATFKAQAAKIFAAWSKVKACTHDDPNQCKIIMDKSCETAFAEIGPNGTVMPGLISPP